MDTPPAILHPFAASGSVAARAIAMTRLRGRLDALRRERLVPVAAPLAARGIGP